MSTYLLRRAASSVVILIGISLLVFWMLHVIGGPPGRAVLGLRASVASVNAWDAEHGFAKPLIIQYLDYMNKLLHGNLGQSYKQNQSVNTILAEHAPISAYLSGLGLFFAIIIAFPVGIYQAVKRNTLGDNAVTTAAFITYSMPVFLLGLLLIQVFAITLNIFPVGASASVSQDSSLIGAITDPRHGAAGRHADAGLGGRLIPGSCARPRLTYLLRTTSRPQGPRGCPSEWSCCGTWVRNACLPMVTLIGLSIPALLAGNLITENIFNYPGLGIMFINALNQEDYPVLIAYTLMGGVLTVIGNYVADVALTVADPRIRLV